MRKIFLVGSLLIWVFATGAVYGESITIVGCPYISSPPKIDGILDDACWKEGPATTDFFSLAHPFPYPAAEAETTLKLGFDQEALYIGLFCSSKIAGVSEDECWREDWLHFMFDPDGKLSGGVYDLVFYSYGPIGAVFVKHEVPGPNEIVSEPTRTGAMHREKDGWSLEVVIPYKDLGDHQPQKGDIWTFGFLRACVTNKSRVLNFSISMCQPEYDKKNYAFLCFGTSPERLLRGVATALVSRDLPLAEGVEFLLPKGVLRCDNLQSICRRKIRYLKTILLECQAMLPANELPPGIKEKLSFIIPELNSLQQDTTQSPGQFQRLSALEERLVKVRTEILLQILIQTQ
ncbi:MAG: hypothetical protein V2A65_08820 [Candidatus Omnitrophota bacterium]